MTRLEALVSLRDAVAGGEWTASGEAGDSWLKVFDAGLRAQTAHIFAAWAEGSLDAAIALFNAVLPGWEWRKPSRPWEKNSVAVQSPYWQAGDDEEEGGFPWFSGSADNPARALLLATLNALIAKEQAQ